LHTEQSDEVRQNVIAKEEAHHEWVADHRFCGPRLFGPVMERSNSCARIGGHSHAVDDQTAALG
jgi:hypothetical protein